MKTTEMIIGEYLDFDSINNKNEYECNSNDTA